MASASITVRTDDKLKAEATRLFANLGMDMTTAVNVFLNAAVNARAIPFAIVEEPDEEYRDWMKHMLNKSFERRNDPATKWYTQDEVEKMFEA